MDSFRLPLFLFGLIAQFCVNSADEQVLFLARERPLASYQFPKASNTNTQAELQEIDDQIRELEEMKRGFVSKALRHEDQAERLQFKDHYYLEARRHMELAEENRQAAAQIQKEIDRLKQRRRQILEKNGAGDGFEDL